MPWDVGFNFRATTGYVTDGSGEGYVLDTDVYPTTRTINGTSVTFGWSSGAPTGSRDRTAAIDVRLAGIHYDTTVGHYFQVDLPSSGTYGVHIGAGDWNTPNDALWDLCDTNTVLGSLTLVGSTNTYDDAMDAVYAYSLWPSSETAANLTFATSAFRLKSRAIVNANVIAHIRLVQTGGAPAVYPLVGDFSRPHIRRTRTVMIPVS